MKKEYLKIPACLMAYCLAIFCLNGCAALIPFVDDDMAQVIKALDDPLNKKPEPKTAENVEAKIATIKSQPLRGKVPFTKSYMTLVDEDTLKNKVQFYTSEKIELYRMDSDPDMQIKKGKIQIKDKERIKGIIIPKGTPCVIKEFLEGDRIRVAVEQPENDEKRWLTFGSGSSENYVLLAQKWENQRGTLIYDGESYLTDEKSGKVCLMVKLRKLNKYKKRMRKLPGVKIH